MYAACTTNNSKITEKYIKNEQTYKQQQKNTKNSNNATKLYQKTKSKSSQIVKHYKNNYLRRNSTIGHKDRHERWSTFSSQHALAADKIKINVSGWRYEISDYLLKKFPTSLLGNESTRARYYCAESDEYWGGHCNF